MAISWQNGCIGKVLKLTESHFPEATTAICNTITTLELLCLAQIATATEISFCILGAWLHHKTYYSKWCWPVKCQWWDIANCLLATHIRHNHQSFCIHLREGEGRGREEKEADLYLHCLDMICKGTEGKRGELLKKFPPLLSPHFEDE